MSMIPKLHQAGDTIVEVLVCMAIVGFGLSVCYGIAHRSLYLIRQSEEHSQSLQLAEGQLERFREYLSLNSALTTNPSKPGFILPGGVYAFCIYNVGGTLKLQPVPSDQPDDPICATDQSGVYYCEKFPALCPAPPSAVDAAGFEFRAGIGYLYTDPTRLDEFYGTAGRYAVNGLTSNSKSFDAATIPYRIHQ